MTAPVTQNLVATFFERAETLGDAPFLWAKRNGAYEAWSWRRTAETVSALSRGLGDLGVEAGMTEVDTVLQHCFAKVFEPHADLRPPLPSAIGAAK